MADSTSLVLYDPRTAEPEVIALAGFLAGYGGPPGRPTRWTCASSSPGAAIASCACSTPTGPTSSCTPATSRSTAKAKATIGRRLSSIAGFYRYAAEEGLIEYSPAVHVRRPRLDYESHAVGLDRNELGAFLVAAGLASPQDHALASLLALDGLRISEALGADIDQLGVERGHRTLAVHRKGGKTVTIPLAPRTARAVDLAIGERLDGPIFVDAHGARLRRDAAARMVRRLAKRAGIAKRIGPHSLRHSFITAALDAGSHCATCRRRRRTPILTPPCATTGPASPSTATPWTSWPPSWPVPRTATPARGPHHR